MECINSSYDSITLKLSHREFNVMRELISAVIVSCTKDEIPTLTGWDRDELLDYAGVLADLADDKDIPL